MHEGHAARILDHSVAALRRLSTALLRRRRAIAAVTAAAVTTVGLLVAAAPAQAALPYCNAISGVYDPVGTVILYETYGTSPNQPNTQCDMYTNQSPTTGQKNAITQLQRSLKLCWNQNISIDGLYGTQTRNAVKNVQNALNFYNGAGLVVDGYAGPSTRQAMTHEDGYLAGFFCHGVRNNPPQLVPGLWYLDAD